MVQICARLRPEPAARALAAAHDPVFYAAGTHPMHVDAEPMATVEALTALAAHPKCVGIGETGLDYYYEHAPREAQQVSFRSHIAAARETGLPLIVHARDADDDTVAVLQDEYAKGAFPGVIHCFTAGPALAHAALELGFYISLAGIVTFKSAEDLRETVRDVPLDRLLVETDSPYLAPVPKRGKTNEPANVVYTADALAKLCGVEAAEFADITTDNFFRLFTRAARP